MRIKPFVRWFIDLVWPQRGLLDKDTQLWAEHLVRLEQVELAEAEVREREDQEKQKILSEKEAQIKLAMDFFSWSKANPDNQSIQASTPAWFLAYHIREAMVNFNKIDRRSYQEEFPRSKTKWA